MNRYNLLFRAEIILMLLFSVFSSGKLDAQNKTVRINELMVVNESSLVDKYGEYSDWIELYNPTETAVNLLGWTLTDEQGVPDKWVFPDVTIEKNGYLVVFASGKNQRSSGSELHTSFKLSSDGEYLALYNPDEDIVSEISPSYPKQSADISWSYFDGSGYSFSISTPAKENQKLIETVSSTPRFSKKHGFYENPFQLTITADQGAQIYYTTDGSAPSRSNAKLYSSALTISTTTIVRAVAYSAGKDISSVATQTFLFLDDVIHQPNDPEDYPAFWGEYCELTGTAIADYEMDPEITNDPAMAQRVKSALLSIPTISLASDKGNFFSTVEDPETGGIYIFTGAPVGSGVGDGWERPASAEYFTADGSKSFQINCGVELEGGHSRLPDKSPKHSFQLKFKKMYGPGKLEFPIFGDSADNVFDNIVLRSGYGSTWINRIASDRTGALYNRDIWAKDTQLSMGHPSCHGTYVHLYINGIYWGIYNPQERMDADFASSYMDGSKEDFDVIKDKVVLIDGDMTQWKTLLKMASAGLNTTAAYQKIQGNNPDGTRNPQYESLLDVENLIDYMLINYYGGNTDWDEHNWAVMRNRVKPGKGFKFFCWDTENNLKGLNDNNLKVNYANCPTAIFNQLILNDDFKRLFAQHVAKHCFGNGVLTPQSNINRFMVRSSYLEGAIDAESARWGDYRRDVHRYFESGPFDLYTKDGSWIPAREEMIKEYFPQRTNIFISQLKEKGWYPKVDAPVIKLNGKLPDDRQLVVAGDRLTLIAAKGTIYFTVDGTDPVDWHPANGSTKGVIRKNARIYSGVFSLEQSCCIKARAYYNGEWSALIEASFLIPDDFHDLKITEINYHPHEVDTIDEGKYEFVEIKNTGELTLDIGGVKFIDGIEYVFPDGTILPPDGFMVLASDEGYYYKRYGSMPQGEFDGKLSNRSETLILASSFGDTLDVVSYSDSYPWPVSADGNGYSIVSVDFNPVGSQNSPEKWRASVSVGGSPGKDDALTDEVVTLNDSFGSEKLTLCQNYPNPFSDVTYVDFYLPEESEVQFDVYNLSGRKVATLASQSFEKGIHQVEWTGCDTGNRKLASGVYLYQITTKNNGKLITQSKKMLITR